MKATVTNVRTLLRSLHIDATSYFSIENGDKAGTVVLSLISSFLYRHDADRIETALIDNFSCAFIRDRKGNLHRIVVSSKETANNTSQTEEPKTELTPNNTSKTEENKDNFVVAIEKTPLNVILNATYNKARDTFERFRNYTGSKLFSDGTTLSDHMHIVNTFGKALGLPTVADIHLTKTQKCIAFTLLCEAKDLILNGSHDDTMDALIEAYQRRMDNNPEIEFHMHIDYTDVRKLIKEACKSYAIKAINKHEGTDSIYSWWSGDDRITNHIEFIDYLIELYR